MIMALAPAVAPALGSLLLEFYTWPMIFIALGVYASIVLVCVSLYLPESLPQVQTLHPMSITRNYLSLLANRHYMTTTLASALLYSGMIAYLSGASFIFIEMMGIPTRYFGALFLTTVAGYIAGSAISTRLARGRESEQVMLIGVRVSVAGSLAMLLATEAWFHPLSVLLPMTLTAAALGIVMPHAMGAALRAYPHMAATASALFGFIQMGLSALAGALVGLHLEADARPMVAVILLGSCTAWWLTRRLQRS
jgi:DHA1 family bicyclomycin/chloramphenicol resistance-like MFS transporter